MTCSRPRSYLGFHTGLASKAFCSFLFTTYPFCELGQAILSFLGLGVFDAYYTELLEELYSMCLGPCDCLPCDGIVLTAAGDTHTN